MMQIPVAMRSEMYICGHLTAEIVDSNSTAGTEFFHLYLLYVV
jgi:hypothetical protein